MAVSIGMLVSGNFIQSDNTLAQLDFKDNGSYVCKMPEIWLDYAEYL
jgi:hypothetical protein